MLGSQGTRPVKAQREKYGRIRGHGGERKDEGASAISGVSTLHPQPQLDPPHPLQAKPVRTASGIAVVAVMSKPHRCPHIATTGNICIYCPGGPDSDFEYSTQVGLG